MNTPPPHPLPFTLLLLFALSFFFSFFRCFTKTPSRLFPPPSHLSILSSVVPSFVSLANSVSFYPFYFSPFPSFLYLLLPFFSFFLTLPTSFVFSRSSLLLQLHLVFCSFSVFFLLFATFFFLPLLLSLSRCYFFLLLSLLSSFFLELISRSFSLLSSFF